MIFTILQHRLQDFTQKKRNLARLKQGKGIAFSRWVIMI